jgi:hypothetical protein
MTARLTIALIGLALMLAAIVGDFTHRPRGLVAATFILGALIIVGALEYDRKENTP